MTLLAVAVAGRGLVDPGAPVFRADDEALLRGGAAFETLRVYDGRPFLLDRHLDRLARSAAMLALPATAGGGRPGEARARCRATRPRAARVPHRARARRHRGGATGRPRGGARARDDARIGRHGHAGAPRGREGDELCRGVRRAPRGRRRRRVARRRGESVRECATANIWWRATEPSHTGCRPGRAAGRDAIAGVGARAGYARGRVHARRAPRGRRGVHDLVDPRGDAGSIGRRRDDRDGEPGPAAARLQAALRLRSKQ